MSLLQLTKYLLDANQIFPKKRLGQTFITDNALLETIVSYADVNSEDIILEIGPGLGFLTQILSRKCKKVIAVEVDPKLVAILRKQLCDVGNVKLIEGDILECSVPIFNKVISTPPYSISSALLFWLLERSFNLAILTFQKEFAYRLLGSVGSKDYGRLTVSTYFRAHVELLDHVSKDVFYPPPNVESTIVRLKPKLPPPFAVKDEHTFFELVQTVFTQRNKKMHNAIQPFLRRFGLTKQKTSKLANSLSFHDKRPHELTPEDFGALADEVIEKTNISR